VHLARFSHHTQSVIYASTKIDGKATTSAFISPPDLLDTIRFLSVHDNSFIRYFKGHTDLVTNITLCPSNDTFLSCSRDNTVLLWNLQSQNYQGKLKLATPYLAAYDAAALVIAIASPSTSHIMLYDIRNYDQGPFGEFDMGRYEEQFLTKGAEWTKLEFTNDGKHLILSTTGAGHFVLDAFEGHLVHFAYRKEGHSGRVGPAITPPSRIPGQRDGITATAGQGDTCVSPDGRYLLGGTGESAIAIWDISKEPASNQYLQPFDHLPGRGKAPIVGYNPRVNLLVSGDKDLYMWQPDPEMM
jgi:COMPASS component SWD2